MCIRDRFSPVMKKNDPPVSGVSRGRGERIVFWWPNTNTNIIRLPKNDRIRIRILFGLPKMTEYEYEYYSASQKWPNTNMNIIRFPKNDRIRIRILFGFPKMTEYEYEYYSVSQKGPNTNIIRFSKNDRIQILFGLFGYIWKRAVEKSKINATNVILHLPGQPI